jgi:hypothetical protein
MSRVAHLQCPFVWTARASFGSLSQDKYSCECALQLDCDFAIGRDDAHLLDQLRTTSKASRPWSGSRRATSRLSTRVR